MSDVKQLVDNLIREEVRELGAYHVPDASGMVKLDAMENPHAWPDDMRQAWQDDLGGALPNRYPDPESKQLVETIRQCFSVPASMDVLLGNGSDELIQMLLMAVASPGRCVLSPEPGFVMYRQIARFLGLEYVGVPLNPDFSLNLPAMLDAIEQHRPSVVFIAYPNNPTGNLFDEVALNQVIKAAPGLVVMDEAYEPFAQKSYMAKAGQPSKLLVMRTVSKLGLAGLRLGYLVGAPELIAELNKVRLPYNINVLTQRTVDYALKHYDVLQQQTDEICQQRTILIESLQSMSDVIVFPSDANFVLFRLKTKRSNDVFEALKEKGILIKNLGNNTGMLHNCLRVTVGTSSENAQFLTALNAVLEGENP